MRQFLMIAYAGLVAMLNGMVLGAQTDSDGWAAIVVTNGLLLTAGGIGGAVWEWRHR